MRLMDDKGNKKDEIKTFCLLSYNSELSQSAFFVHFNHRQKCSSKFKNDEYTAE